MNSAPHLEASLQQGLDDIRTRLLKMGHLCEVALNKALAALEERDVLGAQAVILRDRLIDQLEREVERQCLEFLVRQQPVGGPLRFAYSSIRINQELERIGDYIESIARQALALAPLRPQPRLHDYGPLVTVARKMLGDALQAYRSDDDALAERTMAAEREADQLRNAIRDELIERQDKGELPLSALTPLLTVARRLERMTDQTKNICEEIIYSVRGESPRHRGADKFRFLFVDDTNACTSQLAEALARSLADSRFVFASAGLRPGPVSDATRKFLASRGVESSAIQPKSVHAVGLPEEYHVMVALSDPAASAFPAEPTKTLCLQWTLSDPSGVAGSEEQRHAAFEATWRELEQRLRPLISAVTEE